MSIFGFFGYFYPFLAVFARVRQLLNSSTLGFHRLQQEGAHNMPGWCGNDLTMFCNALGVYFGLFETEWTQFHGMTSTW